MSEAFKTQYTTIDNGPCKGLTLKTEFFYDYDAGAPWENSDGHGDVRRVYAYYGRPEKRPGERVLWSDRGTYWLYDWQGACKKARADGWNTAPYDAPNRVERAVKADFDYLRGYLSDAWHYVGVAVTLEDEDGERVVEDSCWRFEYLDDYHEEQAKEMGDALVASHGEELEARDYWASRDVITKGF